jgi:ribonuclease HIII
VGTVRSPAIRIYRRDSTRFEPLRELLIRNDFHPVTPADALAEWEYRDDRGTRIRYWRGTALVEAEDDAQADEFDTRHRTAMPSDGAIPDGGAAPELVALLAGSDESGKGERERSLAVAAVAVPVESEREALARGIRDSKLCTAAEIAELARWIARRFAHAIRVIPRESRSDALHAHGRNESRLLAALHAECLLELHARAPFQLARVDRFAPNRPVARVCPAFIVDECVRGERHIACAAASILARHSS